MKKLAALAVLVLTTTFCARAQTTSVSATVTDPGSNPYKNGSYTVSFSPNPSFPTASYNIGGTPIAQGPFSGSLDATGTFIQVLADNVLTNPKGSSWIFQICSFAGNSCFTLNTPVSGSTLNLSTALSAKAVAITGNTQISTSFSASARGVYLIGAGGQSQDLLDVYGYDGTKYFSVGPTGTVFCLSGCSGGGGSPGGSAGQIQFNNTGTFGGTGDFTFDGTHTYTFGAAAILTLTSGATLNGLTLAMMPGGVGLTASPLSQFALTTSAQLASIISDETGTGFSVFSNSPTLVTPNLGTPSAINLTNASGFPTLNQNTTGNAATATALAAAPTTCSTNVAATGVNASGNAVGCFTPTAGPGGSANSVQVNNAGALNGVLGSVTGQPLIAQNASLPIFASPGLLDGNGVAAVTTTPYVIACDSATTLLDRTTTLRFQSGASVITAPDHTATGCGGGMSFILMDDGAGTLTINRGGTDTFTVLDGTTNTDGATSFTLTNGQYATLNNGAAGIWEARIVKGGGGGGGAVTITASQAASTPGLSMTGAPFTAGTGTTAYPYFYINDGTAPTTWSTSGTVFGVNAPSGYGGNFLEFRVNGGANLFQVGPSGKLIIGNSSMASAAVSAAAYQINSTSHIFISQTAPTISSGFGTSPSIVANNGTVAFTLNVGTGGSATSGVVGLPTAATGWVCFATDQTTPGANVTKQSANSTTSATLTNYSATTGVAAAWTASDVLVVSCHAF